MKKLIICAIAMAVAAVTQAASVDWATAKGTIKNQDGSTAQGVTAYLINTDSAAYSAMLAGLTDGTITAANIGEAGKDWSNAYLGSATTGTGSKNGGRLSGTGSSAEMVVGETYNLAYVLFDQDGDGKDVYYLSSTTGGRAWSTADEQALATSAEWATTSDAGKWTAVSAGGGSSPIPEPTSGLLVVLGLAGLALKRKVA